jgi:hypothetical protein
MRRGVGVPDVKASLRRHPRRQKGQTARVSTDIRAQRAPRIGGERLRFAGGSCGRALDGTPGRALAT